MKRTASNPVYEAKASDKGGHFAASAMVTRIRRWLSLEVLEGTWVERILGADLRSLAALRVCLAFIVVMDMAGRWSNLRIHYTEEGVMPRWLVVENFVRWRWSLHLINDTYEFQAGLLLLTLIAALCMMVGYRTRMMTIIVAILIASVQARNSLVLSGADTLLRVLLFWAMFLPLGAVWSVDAARRSGPVRYAKRMLSFGTIGIFLQIAFMYWFTAALKSSPEWRTEGTALYYALGANHITKPFGEYLHQFPELLRFLTHASLGLEIVAPILLFSPFFTGPVRTLAVASVMSFHVGIFLTMDVGIFPWTSALCMVCFLPSWFWDSVLPRIREAVSRHLPEFGTKGRSLLHPAQAMWTAARLRLEKGQLLLSTAGMAPSTRIYSTAATSSGAEGPPPPHDDDMPTRILRSLPITNMVLAFCLIFVFLWNWASVSDFRMPSESRPFAYSSGLYQRWNMFAPHPSKSTSWVVVRGVLADGTDIDVLTPMVHNDLSNVSLLSWAEPDDIVGEYYGDKYWRKYLTAIVRDGKEDERRAFAAYTCRTWNRYYGGDVRLSALQIANMRQPTLPDYEEAQLRRSIVAEYRCA